MRPAGLRSLSKTNVQRLVCSHHLEYCLPSSLRAFSTLQQRGHCRYHRYPAQSARLRRGIYRRLLSTASTPGHDSDSVVFPLNNRTLLAVTGQDAASFLQGLTTNNIPFDEQDESAAPDRIPRALSSAFLNAQGRMLQDVLIYHLPQSSTFWQCIGIETKRGDFDGPGFLIEVDTEQLANLSKSLRRYKLRSKVTISPVDAQEATVASIWNDNVVKDALPSVIHSLRGGNTFLARDDRAPGLGFRAIVSTKDVSGFKEARTASAEEYRARRYLHSIPEGQAELPSELSLVHDSDMDYMHGVDFRKGCYVGQELVIRTQHTGVVRKRILPVMLYRAGEEPPQALGHSTDASSAFPSISYGADIKKAGETDSSSRKTRSAGKLVANVGNIGLAMARLEQMVGLGPTGDKLEGWQAPELVVDHDDGSGERLRVKAFVPDWWGERRILKAP